MSKRPLILVPGLVVNRLSMLPWERALVRSGAYQSAKLTGDEISANSIIRPKLYGIWKKQFRDIPQQAKTLCSAINIVKETSGTEKVDLMAHSEGGLICRAADQLYDYSESIENLIMLATPNKGVTVASEGDARRTFREILTSWGDAGYTFATAVKRYVFQLFKYFPDGKQLCRDQSFIEELNSRELSDSVNYTVIAGNRWKVKSGAGGKIIGTDGLMEVGTTYLEEANKVKTVDEDHLSILFPGEDLLSYVLDCVLETEI